MVQHQWYHFGIGAPPILVYFSGDWYVNWGYGVLTHSQMKKCLPFFGVGDTERHAAFLFFWKGPFFQRGRLEGEWIDSQSSVHDLDLVLYLGIFRIFKLP